MTDFLLIRPGDVVAVSMPDEEPFLGEVLHVEGGARTGHPSYAQVIREDDLAIAKGLLPWKIGSSGFRVY